MEAPQIIVHGADGGHSESDTAPSGSAKVPTGSASAGLTIPAGSGSHSILQVSSGIDKYTAGIELSNACRDFYVSRLRTAESMRTRLASISGKEDAAGGVEPGDGGQTGLTTTPFSASGVSSGNPKLDNAMAVLRKEMVSVV